MAVCVCVLSMPCRAEDDLSQRAESSGRRCLERNCPGTRERSKLDGTGKSSFGILLLEMIRSMQCYGLFIGRFRSTWVYADEDRHVYGHVLLGKKRPPPEQGKVFTTKPAGGRGSSYVRW